MKSFYAGLFIFSGLLTGQISAKEIGIQTAIVRTNFVDHWITNTAEIQLQVNRFVTEFHTNWITQVRTNVVDVFSTNLLTAYHTNRLQQTRTNFVDVFATNFLAKTVTNRFVLDLVETNFVQAYHTNLKTLNLTNWTTIVALRTNWVTKPMTNLVDIDVATADPAPIVTHRPVSKKPAASEPLALQASRGFRPTPNNQVEVQIKVSWSAAPADPVQVQQWRIESEDGSVLCFGQDPEFKRILPTGIYKVLVRAQREAKGPLLAALGTLTVTSQEVLLEQRPARSNSSI